MNHINVQKVLDYLQVVGKQDFPAAATFFTANVEYRVSGNNKFSGVFFGPNEVMGYFGKMMEVSRGTYKVNGFKDWLVSEDRVLALAEEEVTINEKSINWTRLILFELDQNKKFSKISFYDENQSALDAIIG